MEGDKNSDSTVLLCSCRKPAKLVVVPTAIVPGMRAWKCAEAQCEFILWNGPWVTPESNAQLNKLCEGGGPPKPGASSTSAPPPLIAGGPRVFVFPVYYREPK